MRRAGRGRRSARHGRGGRFIVLEGLDGAGTTTQAAHLAGRLRASGRTAHLTAEPSAGPIGALVRQVLTGRIGGGRNGFDPRSLALLFAADRLDHVAVELAPKLTAGVDVVCDRYTLSSLAYQGAQLRDVDWIEALNREAPRADLVLFLRCRPEIALGRRRAASLDREIFEVDAFQRRVARAYDSAIRRRRRAGELVAEVDGERSIEEVAAAIWDVVARLR